LPFGRVEAITAEIKTLDSWIEDLKQEYFNI
jgi:hypothetical protein